MLVGGDPVDERVLLPGPSDLLPHLSAERLPRRQLEQEAGGIQHLQARQRETKTPMRKVLWIRKYFFQIHPDPRIRNSDLWIRIQEANYY